MSLVYLIKLPMELNNVCKIPNKIFYSELKKEAGLTLLKRRFVHFAKNTAILLIGIENRKL